jgi:hypothetical protein
MIFCRDLDVLRVRQGCRGRHVNMLAVSVMTLAKDDKNDNADNGILCRPSCVLVVLRGAQHCCGSFVAAHFVAKTRFWRHNSPIWGREDHNDTKA